MTDEEPAEALEAALERLRRNASAQQHLSALAANLERYGYHAVSSIDVRGSDSSLRLDTDVRRDDSGLCLEAFVDTPLASRAVCWWCDVYRSDGIWRIESRVIATTRDGQDTLEEFPDIEVRSAEDLEAAFEAVVARLVQSHGWSRYVE